MEGFKHEHYNKIEIHRSELKKDYIFLSDPNVIAIASDSAKIVGCPIKQLAINNSQEIFDFVTQYANSYRHD